MALTAPATKAAASTPRRFTLLLLTEPLAVST